MAVVSDIMSAPPPPRGFSLVELMVALAISLFLLLGVVYVYVSSKNVYRVQDNLARMQESGRLAFQYLSQDLRMAGYFGCASAGITPYAAWPDPSQADCPTPTTAGSSQLFHASKPCGGCDEEELLPANAVYGYNGGASSWSPAKPTRINDAVVGTDIISIWGSIPLEAAITGSTSGQSALTVDKDGDAAGIKENDVLIAANCQNSFVFKASGVPAAKTIPIKTDYNRCTTLKDNYQGATLLKVAHNTYFIKNDGDTPTLFRKPIQLGNTPSPGDEPLVPYVENMQVTYGWSPTPEEYPTQYYSAAEMEDAAKGQGKWGQVKSVRIDLLVCSPDDNLAAEPQIVNYNGANITPADHRLRLVMTTTIGVRNRMLLSSK